MRLYRLFESGRSSTQITLGMPFYGRGWTAASTDNYGLYQKLTRGTVSGTAYTYRNLLDKYVGKNDYARYWSYGAKYRGCSTPKNGFSSLEDPESIGYKADYVADITWAQ
jgi:chitinase